MSGDLSAFSSPEMKDLLQEMRDLFSQRQLAFLLGAGCSKIAGLPLMPELTKEVLEHGEIGNSTKKLLNKIKDLFSGSNTATIEDYMSEIVDLLSISERRVRRGATQSEVSTGDLETNATELRVALDEIKAAISSAIGKKQVNISTHQQFVRAVHGTLQAGKPTRCVDYFVLNYDTLIEDALGLEQVVYCDGFIGGATGWWEPSTFTRDGKSARVFKVHGSIDWCLLKDDSLPRRVRPTIETGSMKTHVLIYPAATKYQETQRDPFAQMLDHLRRTLRPGKNKETVLAICGYGFGDSHINLEIQNALYQSDGRLTIVAFVGTDEPQGELKEWLDDPKIADQIRVYAEQGFFHGDRQLRKDAKLPWWKFEILARLLGGER